MTQHPSDGVSTVASRAAGRTRLPVGWPRLAAGLATLRAEVARVRGGAASTLSGLAVGWLPAVAGVSGAGGAGGLPAPRGVGRHSPVEAARSLAVAGGSAEPGGSQPGEPGRPGGAGGRAGATAGMRDASGDVVTLDLVLPGMGRGTVGGSADGPGGSPAEAGLDAAGLDAADLVRRVKDGEADAFGVLYDHYSERVYHYVFYRVGSTALAEDIVSETFLRALRRIGSFTWRGTDIGAWFITIARNLVIDHSRSSRTRLEFPTDDILSTADAQAADTAGGPEDSVLTVLRDRVLLDAVRALSPDQQECVVLRFLEGFSLRETALAMGRNENAIKALQLRAVRSLARQLPPPSELI